MPPPVLSTTVLIGAGVATTLVATLAYIGAFHAALLDGEWLNVGGYTRLLIPDTFLYRDLLEEDLALGFFVAGVKNAIGPALLWLVAGGNWYAVAVINAGLLLLTLVYARAICRHLDVSPGATRATLLILGFLPVMFFHSVGALKELPTLAATTGFVYHWMRGHTWRWLVMAIVLVLLRYQLVPVLCAFTLVDRFARNRVRAAVLLMLALSAAYPLFSSAQLVARDATELYREEASSSSIGALVENVRSNVPGLSSLAVAVRVLQTISEPFQAPFREDGSLSVLGIVYAVSLFLMVPAWSRTAIRLWQHLLAPRSQTDAASLLAFTVLFIVPVAGFSFVHHRYLFPVTALLLIAGSPGRSSVQ